MARLAARVPRPRAHRVRYHGLFAPNAKHRQHIVTGATAPSASDNGQRNAEGGTSEPQPTAPMNWMQRSTPGCSIPTCRAVPDAVDTYVSLPKAAHPCARGFSASVHVTEPVLIARIIEHRDGRDDFSGKVPAGGARPPPAVSLH